MDFYKNLASDQVRIWDAYDEIQQFWDTLYKKLVIRIRLLFQIEASRKQFKWILSRI